MTTIECIKFALTIWGWVHYIMAACYIFMCQPYEGIVLICVGFIWIMLGAPYCKLIDWVFRRI